MKILSVKLTKGGREYRASIAVYKNMPVEEFMSLLRASLPILDASVMGFKDCEGVLLVPSFICCEPELLTSDNYELVLAEKPSRPTSASSEDRLGHIVSDLRMKSMISEEQYLTVQTWIQERNQMLTQAYRTYLEGNDLEGFAEWLKRTSAMSCMKTDDLMLSEVRERPSTTIGAQRPMTRSDSKNYHKFIKVVVDMESQGFFDQRDLGIIKALILRENSEVMKEFDNYFLKNVSLHEMAKRLQRLANKLSGYMERPSSPVPRKDELEKLVDSLVKENLRSEEDIEILNKLIEEENEFVFSAFDVFESDRDQEELVDSLQRAITKYKNTSAEPQDNFYLDIPPVENSPSVEVNYYSVKKVIENLGLTRKLDFQSAGTLYGLLKNNSKTLYKCFSQYFKNKDELSLSCNLEVLCRCYFTSLLGLYFDRFQVVEIFERVDFPDSEVKTIFEVFSLDGNATGLLSSLCSVLDLQNSIEPNAWEVLLNLLEKDKDSENLLRKVVHECSSLKPYKELLNSLLEKRTPKLLSVLESFTLTKHLQKTEQKLLELCQKHINNHSSNLLEIAKSNFAPDDLEVIENHINKENSIVVSAFEVYKTTGDQTDLLETLELVVQESRSLTTEEDNFTEFVRNNFQKADQKRLFNMVEEKDPRIKAALDLYDLTSDQEDLIETLNYLLKTNEE